METMYATASGAKSRPSMPESAKSGRKTRTTTAVPKTSDERISALASIDHQERGPGRGGMVVLAQAAEDVLHVHHRIVDQFAKRHRDAAERHHVDGERHARDRADKMEHDRRDRQGERDRGQRDERRAEVHEEQEEHDQDEDRANRECLGDIGDAAVDEVAEGVDVGFDEHVAGKGLFELAKRRLHLGGDGASVAVRLLDHRDDDAGLADDAGIAALDLRVLDDACDLFEQDGPLDVGLHDDEIEIGDDLLGPRTQSAEHADRLLEAAIGCEPAARVDVVRRRAASTSVSDSPKSCSAKGSTSTWYCLRPPPTVRTWATPGIFCNRGRTTQSASVRSDELPLELRREDEGDRPAIDRAHGPTRRPVGSDSSDATGTGPHDFGSRRSATLQTANRGGPLVLRTRSARYAVPGTGTRSPPPGPDAGATQPARFAPSSRRAAPSAGRTSGGKSPAPWRAAPARSAARSEGRRPNRTRRRPTESPHRGLRPHVANAARAEDGGLDGKGDERLDFLGGEAGALGHDRDARPVEVGEDVDRHRRGQVRAVSERDEARDHDERAVAEREAMTAFNIDAS